MRRLGGRLFLSAVAAVGLGGAVLSPRWVRSAPPAADAAPPSGEAFQLQGVAGCAAAACHGMNGPKGSKGSEYVTWIAEDPHAKAYLALFNERSRRIEKNLKKLATLEEAKPYENALCLKCHATSAPKSQLGPRFVLEDGVGCESCHGPSQKWLGVHHLPGWTDKSVEEKAKFGMRDTKDLLTRAQACAECHVGAADREVNHDLIAAGHPRLNFEFGTYLANLPKHWQEKGDNARPDFEARAWAVGQVASLRAALELLEARAIAAVKDDKKNAPPGEKPVWPEFAEYDCFACHHGLRDEEWRRQRDFTKRRPGSYPWSTWYLALAPALSKHLPNEGAAPAVASFDELSTLMSNVRPDPGQVAEKARAAGKQLTPWARNVNGRQLSAEVVNRLLGALSADEPKLAGAGWDNSAQLYLALAALHQAHRAAAQAPQDKGVLGQLQKLYDGLEFKAGYSSPTGFKADAFKDELNNLHKLLRQ